jgi:hypothetical protein
LRNYLSTFDARLSVLLSWAVQIDESNTWWLREDLILVSSGCPLQSTTSDATHVLLGATIAVGAACCRCVSRWREKLHKGIIDDCTLQCGRDKEIC